MAAKLQGSFDKEGILELGLIGRRIAPHPFSRRGVASFCRPHKKGNPVARFQQDRAEMLVSLNIRVLLGDAPGHRVPIRKLGARLLCADEPD